MTAIDQHANPKVSSAKLRITDHPSSGNLPGGKKIGKLEGSDSEPSAKRPDVTVAFKKSDISIT